MTTVRFSFDLGAALAALDQIERLELDARDWALIGQRAVVAILERTERGLNAYGLPFARYAPSTARARVRKGRKVSAVTLAYTGKMLGALTSEGIEGGVRLSFVTRAAQDLAELHIRGTRRMPRRNFLEIAPRTQTENQLADLAAKLLVAKLRRAIAQET